MKTLHQLMQEIIQLTTNIETNYPELYKYLNETPMEIGSTSAKTIHTSDLEEYLVTLKLQLKHHIETHKNKKD